MYLEKEDQVVYILYLLKLSVLQTPVSDEQKEKQKIDVSSLRHEVTMSVDHKRRKLQNGEQELKQVVL